jgi:glycosyltransferase A (GT-A) superfamily protein (DUF2064 family)
MAERMVQEGRLLRDRFDLSLEIHFTGGSLHQLQAWLGSDLHYQPQVTGSLGDRLKAVLQTDTADSPISQPQISRPQISQPQISQTPISRPVVIVGTDCPAISVELLERSFQALEQADLVLGPACDGGYYLIGLRQNYPELFEGITWSSDRVFQETINIAQRQGLAWVELERLPDIDRPEDLQYLPRELWEPANPAL